MTHSTLTNRIRISTQSSPRNGSTVDTFLIHHAATVSSTGESIVNMMVNKTREVSSNYVIGGDGTIWLVVDEDRRAWTSGSSTDGGRGAAWDRRSITVEIANESGSPDWGISAAAIDSAAKLLNDLRSRYSISNVLGHRDLWESYRASYPTYCPGPDTVSRVLSRASQSEQTKDIDMRIIYNTGETNSGTVSLPDATRRAIIGELTFQVITGPQSTRERKFWGDPVNVTVGEWDAARDLVIARRRELGLPVNISQDGSVSDYAISLDISSVPGTATGTAVVRNP